VICPGRGDDYNQVYVAAATVGGLGPLFFGSARPLACHLLSSASADDFQGNAGHQGQGQPTTGCGDTEQTIGGPRLAARRPEHAGLTCNKRPWISERKAPNRKQRALLLQMNAVDRRIDQKVRLLTLKSRAGQGSYTEPDGGSKQDRLAGESGEQQKKI